MKLLIELIVGIVWTVSGLSVAFAESPNNHLTEHEAYVLLDQLFDLSVIDNNNSAQLQRYKQWEDVYFKRTREKYFNNSQMKVYLFMVFVAEQKAKIDSLEEMAKEIVPIFRRQPTVFLTALQETPFLLSTVCDRIGMHFELFGNKLDQRKFVDDYQAAITNALGKKSSAKCLASITRLE